MLASLGLQIAIIIKNFKRTMENEHLDCRNRNNIQLGQEVDIVQKQHQKSEILTAGIVKRILTNSSNHHQGIKVMLESGEVGRVKNILID